MTLLETTVANGLIKPSAADAFQVGHVPFGVGHAFGLVSRIGRDRLDAQQREQAIEARIEIGIDPLQHRIKLAHEVLREKLGRAHS